MTRDAFNQALEQELRRRGTSFGLAAMLAFVEGAWPLIAENPDPGFWADEFLEAQGPVTPG